MRALRKKLNSSRGASILMALLFLLVCMMVGASVLMAAASNAGKLRSNREEQQKYLTLSSALTLIYDELESVEYVGRYQYEQKEMYRTELDTDGNAVSVLDHYDRIYSQQEGELRAGGSPWKLKQVLPLYNDLDIFFANQFKVPAGQQNPLDKYIYTRLDVSAIQPKSPHTVKLAANTDETYGGLSEPVIVTVQMRNNGNILVMAFLENHPEYIMEAMLKSNKKPDQLLVLNNSPSDGNNETEPIQWTLDYIVKKGKEAEGG